MVWLIALIIVIVFLVILFIGYYNRFAVLSNRIDNSLAQIDVQLRKRADLIPNLINTVKGAAKFERSVLNQVTKARTEFLKAKDIGEKVKAGNQMQAALKSIFAVAENYPQLQSSKNFLHLQQELSAIEDKVAYARQYYNDSIMAYNNSSRTFPGKFFFKLFGFKEKEYLKIPQESKAVPEVDFKGI